MRAGRMRERVTLQSKSVARDSIGGEIVTWVDEAEVWAEVAPLRGREYFTAEQFEAETTTRVCIRYRSDLALTSVWRLTWREQQYEIEEVIDVEARDREWELMCNPVAHE